MSLEPDKGTVVQNGDDFVLLDEEGRPSVYLGKETQMSNELSIIQAVSNVGQAVMSMMSSAMSMKTVRKQDALLLEERLCFLKNVCRAQGVGHLTRTSINEMDKTLQNIKQKDYTGTMLDMSMNMLNIQYELLCQIIRDYYPS